jgi:hypothetical protein
VTEEVRPTPPRLLVRATPPRDPKEVVRVLALRRRLAPNEEDESLLRLTVPVSRWEDDLVPARTRPLTVDEEPDRPRFLVPVVAGVRVTCGPDRVETLRVEPRLRAEDHWRSRSTAAW